MRDDTNWDWLINFGIVVGTIILTCGLILVVSKYFIPLPSQASLSTPSNTPIVSPVASTERIFARPALLSAKTYAYPQESVAYLLKFSLARGFVQGVNENYPCDCYFQVIGKDKNNKEVFMRKFPARPVNSNYFIDAYGQMNDGFGSTDTAITQDCLLQPCLSEEFYGLDGKYFYRLIVEGPDGYEVRGNWEYLGIVHEKKKNK